MAALAQGKKSIMIARIASYNVLNPAFCNHQTKAHIKKEYLDPEKRFENIVDKLKDEVDQKAIICLQEVSREWSAKFSCWFQQNDFFFIHHSYGEHQKTEMGCAIAIPRCYTLLDCTIPVISRQKYWPKPAPAPMGLYDKLKQLLFGTLPRKDKADQNEDYWDMAKNRKNTAIFVKLSCRITRIAFVVGTYHMPSLHFIPQVIIIHTALLSQSIKNFAGYLPYILAGDFNFVPNSIPDRILKYGVTPESLYETIKMRAFDPWYPVVRKKLRSVYQEIYKKSQPTMYFFKYERLHAKSIDHIYISPEWEVLHAFNFEVEKLKMPPPNKTEPSDHVLIAATLFLPKRELIRQQRIEQSRKRRAEQKRRGQK